MGNKKSILYTLIFFILLNQVLSLPSGIDYSVLNVKCYGQVLLTVRSKINLTDYVLENCQLKNNMWVCGCSNSYNTNIYLRTNNDTINKYDIVAEYYILPKEQRQEVIWNGTVIDDSSKRTVNINNLEFSPIKQGPQPLFNFPALPKDSSFYLLISIIGIIFIVGGVGVYAFLKYFFTSKEDTIPKKVYSTKETTEEINKMMGELK